MYPAPPPGPAHSAVSPGDQGRERCLKDSLPLITSWIPQEQEEDNGGGGEEAEGGKGGGAEDTCHSPGLPWHAKATPTDTDGSLGSAHFVLVLFESIEQQ